MKTLLNLDGYGLTLELTDNNIYRVTEDEYYCVETHYEYDNRNEAMKHIVDCILDTDRIYDPESVPEDLANAYNFAKTNEHEFGFPVTTLLYYTLDSIASSAEYQYRVHGE